MSGIIAALVSFVLPKWIDVRPTLISRWYVEIWIQLTLTLHASYLVYKSRHGDAVGKAPTWRDMARELVYVWGIGLGFAGLLAMSIDGEWRVLSDQTNLLGSSLSFYLDRTYQNITEGYFYYDILHPTSRVLDNRPPLYSFFISIFHDLFGYSANHGFHVNLAVAVALGVVYYCVATKSFGKRRYGILALLFLAGLPFVGQAIRSSGFEAINLLFLSLFYWQAYEILRKPSTEQVELLLLLLLGAAMCRYESIVLAGPAFLVCIWVLPHLEWNIGSLRLLLIPFGFVPLNWQRFLTTSVNPGDHPTRGVFGLKYLGPNLCHLIEFLFDPQFKGFPTSPHIVAISVVGFLVLMGQWWRRGLSLSAKRMILIMGLGTVGIIIAQCSFYLGDVRQVFQHRFAVSYAPVLVVLGLVGFLWFEEEFSSRFSYAWGKWLLWSAFIALGINGLRQAQIAYQGRWLILFREYKSSLGFLMAQPRQSTLFISDRPGMYVVHQYGAISFDSARLKMGDLSSDLKRKLYQAILVEQRISYVDEAKARPELHLEKGYKLEPVFELQNDADYYVRISKLVLSPESPAPQGEPSGENKDQGKSKNKKGKSDRSKQLERIPKEGRKP